MVKEKKETKRKYFHLISVLTKKLLTECGKNHKLFFKNFTIFYFKKKVFG